MNIIKEETSEFSMKDYYKVLKYLPKSRVDRQEPCQFEKLVVKGSNIIIPTIHRDFNGTDSVQLFLNCHDVNIDVSNLTLGFSALVNGNGNLLQLNCMDTSIDVSDDTILQFIIDENYSATDNSRLLTGVESIVIDFKDDATGVELQRLLIRSEDYTYTLDDLDTACENGQAYVLRRLNNLSNEKQEIKIIPDLLKQYVYMAAGAYAWLTRWEYEAKPMKEPKSESNNYADRLLNQVDDGITKYLSNIENNRNEEYIRMDLFKVAKAKW